ncbi:hypothetical protein [Streptomyces anulatus]|uniref:hypothetical protein n=1 Tax=Streptomyces anulatus TaxID=1892 RepID=UPI000ADF010F|nr:hypothetical protein [Streptomyces anulatus]
MRIWPGWRLHLERTAPKRCRFTLKNADGPMRCIFHAGHPDHGHNCSDDLTSPPVEAAAWNRGYQPTRPTAPGTPPSGPAGVSQKP